MGHNRPVLGTSKHRLIVLALLAAWAAPAIAAAGVGAHLSLAHGAAVHGQHSAPAAEQGHGHHYVHDHGRGHGDRAHGSDHRGAALALARALEHGHVHGPSDSGEETAPEHDHDAVWTSSGSVRTAGARPAAAGPVIAPNAPPSASGPSVLGAGPAGSAPDPTAPPLFRTNCALLL